jgi:hypothetical protein
MNRRKDLLCELFECCRRGRHFEIRLMADDLLLLAQSGQSSTLRERLRDIDCNPNIVDDNFDTPLLLAAACNEVGCITALLEDSRVQVAHVNKKRQNVFHQVSANGAIDALRLFLEL